MPSQKYWRSQIDAARQARDKLLPKWRRNVEFRKGRPTFTDEVEGDKSLVAVPIDASYTKAKIASLFSQVPAVAVTPKDPRWAAAAPAFAKELNEVLQTDAKVERAMEECLADVINAAGIAAAKVGYEATFEDVEVPAVDPAMLPPEVQLAIASGTMQLPMETVKRTVSERFYAERISPANLLWPAKFTGSDFDEAPWIGYEGKLTVAQGKRQFNLTDEQISDVEGAGKLETLNDEHDEECADDTKSITFTELYYHSARHDAEELYFDKIKRIVFIDGLKEPIIDEDLQWQKWDEDTGQYIGVCKYPIRVLTLTYISDEAVPPSDSEMGRPQVLETMRTRAQIIEQRDHSKPIRWADTNRMDPMVMDNLQRGYWQGFIPTQGPGDRAIGEVARSHYPPENWDFERVIRGDLQESWQLGANQSGQFATGERSASEAQIVQSNYQTRVGVERAKVAKFFVSIAESLAALMQLYKDRPEDLIGGEQSLQAMQLPKNVKCTFSIKPDSTVLLEASERFQRLNSFLNLAGKSGFANVQYILGEMASLAGLDPTLVMQAPAPPPVEQPNISIRLSGMEDLMTPLGAALLIKSGQAPTPEEMQAGQMMLADAATPPMPMPEPQLPQGEPGRPTVAETGQLPPIVNPAPNPEWGPMERITKRVDEVGG